MLQVQRRLGERGVPGPAPVEVLPPQPGHIHVPEEQGEVQGPLRLGEHEEVQGPLRCREVSEVMPLKERGLALSQGSSSHP